jgi:diguanylate cyclase (GGDEF)-like protein
MADDEPRVLRIVTRALDAVDLQGGAELLLADSSQAHLRRAVATRDADASCARCGVSSPRHCVATRAGSTQVFPSSAALDACPFLGDREYPPCSATCIPVSIAGRTVGVLHAVGADKRLPSQAALSDLTMIATHAGSRLGVLRAMEASERAATTDPLTGLYNCRSLEARVDTLLRANERFALAIADIDHFKKLNDTHGHTMGDRTLQTFARTLRACMRPDDVVARYGGEEFVLVVVGVDAAEAEAALERIRSELPTATARAGVPSVTASYGLTDSTHAGSLDALIRIADDALYTAKREGRDRIVQAPEPARRPVEPPVALALSRA